MAQTVLWGTDASATMPSGIGALFSAFTLNITQGLAEAVGFGDTFMRRHGTVIGATGEISGFTTYGATSDTPGLALITRSGSSLTLTFFTGCTMAFNAIFTGVGLGVQFLANQTSSVSFASDGVITQTWNTGS